MNFPLRTLSFLLVAVVSGCLNHGNDSSGDSAPGGVDARPQGPPISDITATPEGAALLRPSDGGFFNIRFPASDGKPAVNFAFAPLANTERLGLAVDIKNDGENDQIGFLDICDTPCLETVAAVRDIGYRLYSIRSGPK